MSATPKYSSTFIFETKNLTEEFDRIDSEIAQRARQIPGFLGEEAWHNEDTGLHAEVTSGPTWTRCARWSGWTRTGSRNPGTGNGSASTES